MKILILENPLSKTFKYKILEKTFLTMFAILPTLYVRKIAAITPKKHNVKVINERFEKIDTSKKYDIVNIFFTTTSVSRVYKLADEFRKKNTIVVLSGLHSSALPDEALQHADSVLIGRGELNWITLLKDLEKNELKKIYYPEDYDKSTINIPPTNVKLPGFMMTGAIEATRGCPYICTFCPEANTPNGNKFYKRPIDEVINEIKSIPQKTIMFYDLSLTIDSQYTKDLFLEMKKLKKKFFCNGNLDILANDEELVKISKEAGCIAWLVGFESFSKKSIENVGKKTNIIELYNKAVKNLHDNKIAIIGDFMFGFDYDTKNVFEDTLKKINELEIDVADFTILTPFPGTPIFNKFENEGRILTNDWNKYSLYNVVFEPNNMSPDELSNGLKKMYKEFYSTKNTTKRIINSIHLGFFPFTLVLARNILSKINYQRL